MNKDYYKLRILLQLFELEESGITVTALSKMFNLGKTYVSKMMHELESDGLVDLSDNRRPCLTDSGIEEAELYASKVQINLHRLLSEGISPKDAMNDACTIALYCSDATNSINIESHRLFSAKQQLVGRETFTGDELCRFLSDGQYNIPFTIYKTKDRDKSSSILSMANSGFVHPCILTVEDGVGNFTLKAQTIVRHSKIAEIDKTGKASLIKYQDGSKYFPSEHIDNNFIFPASAVMFHNLRTEGKQIIHGFIRLSIQCDIGIMYMPQSTAICTFSL